MPESVLIREIDDLSEIIESSFDLIAVQIKKYSDRTEFN